MNDTKMIIVDAKIEALETLLGEIAEHMYTRSEHVESHIRTVLDIFNNIRDSFQYEIDARGKE